MNLCHSINSHCFTCGSDGDPMEPCHCGSYDLEHTCYYCGYGVNIDDVDEECPEKLEDAAAEIIRRFSAVAVFKIRLERHMAKKTWCKISTLPEDINGIIASWL